MKIKESVKKALFPPAKALLVIDLLTVILLLFALGFPQFAGYSAYVIYLFSVYALTVTIIGIKRLVQYIKILVKNDRIPVVVQLNKLLHKSKFFGRYIDDKDFRAEVSLYAGLAINLLYGIFKGATGALYESPWLWSMGIYYLAIGGIRFMLMRGIGKHLQTGDTAAVKLHEYRIYRRCGVMMLFMNITVAGLAIQMIWQNKANEYSRTVVIISAAYTFYSFILALVNMISFRKRNNAILSAAKDLTFCGAVMSMLSLQTSMLYAFDEGRSDFRQMFNGITGGFVIAIVLGISTYMIINGTKKIKMLSE